MLHAIAEIGTSVQLVGRVWQCCCLTDSTMLFCRCYGCYGKESKGIVLLGKFNYLYENKDEPGRKPAVREVELFEFHVFNQQLSHFVWIYTCHFHHPFAKTNESFLRAQVQTARRDSGWGHTREFTIVNLWNYGLTIVRDERVSYDIFGIPKEVWAISLDSCLHT